MWKNILISFSLAISTIRSRFFHTVLSVLGIVIGVASLVGILSLIDGMEQYANEQISKTTSLKALFIFNKPDKMVNGIRVQKDSFSILSPQQFDQLHASLSLPSDAYMLTRQGREVTMQGDTQRTGAMMSGALPKLLPQTQLARGKTFTASDLSNRNLVAVVNEAFVHRVAGGAKLSDFIGKKVQDGQKEFTIVGIVKSDTADRAEVYFPISLVSPEELRTMRPEYILEAKNVENVPALKAQALAWISQNVPNGKENFEVFSNESRVEQAAQGFLIFRLIMGVIVGISVLVGGIGVMNVLLISVSERTVEIGVRKAVGAKKRDIVLQFLSESVTISIFGSGLGVLMGIGSTMIIAPIVSSVAKVPFQAAYTWNTMLVIAVVAVIIGIVFGTYPAMQAAKLDPVEAIRRE